MARRIRLRRFHRGEKKLLYMKLHDRKLPLWIAQRYRVIASVYEGASVRETARQLGCDKGTVCRCVAEFNERGFQRFERCSNPEGRPTQITQRQLQTLKQIAKKRPTDVGMPFTNWSMTKLQEYLVKHRKFPEVNPEWLRRLLHREQVSWQHTKTWKQSRDPNFAGKKSVFCSSTHNVRSAAQWCATISLDPWNCVRWPACVGRSNANRSDTARPILASREPNNCMAFMMFMPIVWQAASASGRLPKTLKPVLQNCDPHIRSRSAFTLFSIIFQPTSEPQRTSFQDTTWKPFTRPRKLRGSMRLNPSLLHCMPTLSRIQTIRPVPSADAGSIATCAGAIESTKAQNHISRDVCVRSLERH